MVAILEKVEGYIFPRGFASRFHVYRSFAQAIPSGGMIQIQFDTPHFDTLNEYDEAVGYNFTPRQAGYYWFLGQASFPALAVGTVQITRLAINGMLYGQTITWHDGVYPVYTQVSHFQYLIPTDVVDVRILQDSGAPQNLASGLRTTYFQGFRVG